MANATNSGKCKWFQTERGFGFIVPDDGAPDVFVHASGLDPQQFPKGTYPKEGQRVTYGTILDKRKGKLTAVDVRVAA